MAEYTKEEIIQKARELARMMAETEEVDFYKRAERQINENEKVSRLIAKIKEHQKEAVNLQHFHKFEALKQVDDQINKLTGEVDQIPIVQEFKQSQTDINGLLQMVSQTISKTVTEQIEKSSGRPTVTSSISNVPLNLPE